MSAHRPVRKLLVANRGEIVCPGPLDTPMTERTIAKIVAANGRTRARTLGRSIELRLAR